MLAAVLFLIIFSFNQINLPRSEEQIEFFITSYGSYANDFENTVLGEMNSESYDSDTYGAPIITSVRLNFQSPLTNEYPSLLATSGFISSDAVVVDKGYIVSEDNKAAVNGFVAFDNEVLALLGINENDYEFLRVDTNNKVVESGGTAYGIKISSMSKIKNLAVFKGDDDNPDIEAYLFIISSQANVKKDGNRQTYFCLKKFFEKYGN